MPGYLGNTALAAVPITVSVVDSPDPVVSGQILMYTWTVTNTGGAKVTDVVGTTHVDLAGIGSPPQLVITSNVGTCAQLNGTVTCTAGVLQGGQVWTVTIRGLVNAPAGSTLNNTVTVTGTKSAQSFSVSASSTTLVLGSGPGGDKPDLSIQKVGPGTVVQSDSFTYQLNVNNTGTMNASNVTVIDNLPAGVTYVLATGTSLFTCSYAAPTVTCVGGLVNAGSNATININVTAPAAPFTGQIANNAVVDPFDTIVEQSEFNNTSATIYTNVIFAPPPPPYTITKAQTLPAYLGLPNVVTPGDTVTYTIVATNISGSRSDYNVLSDATQGLEASSLTVSATLTGGGAKLLCSIAAPTATCTWTQWPAGASITMIITGRVIASAGSTIRDTATIQGNVRNTGYSASTTLVSTVKPGVDLTITKSDSPDPVCASSWPPSNPAVLCSGGLTYTFVVGNSGIVAATGVTVRDPLPTGLIFDSYSSTGGFTCTVDAANVLTCTGGTIPAQSTATITIVLSAPSTVGSITNTVTVDPTNAIFESDETNNVASQTTTIGTGIDLTILKTDVAPGFDPIATSGTQTYTITVDNIGPQDATNIRVRDALPAGTIFISATEVPNGDGMLNGFTCSYSAGIVECINGHIIGTRSESYDPPGPIAPLGLDTATIIIKVFAQPIVGTMHNEVRVDPLGEIAEINENNNFDFEDTVVVTGNAPVGAFIQLTILKTQTSPANPVARNTIVTYDLLIENKGTDPAYGITVRDTLPAGSIYIEAKDTVSGPDAFSCVAVALVVTCNGGTLSGTVTTVPGVPTSRHITVRMFAPNIPGTYINQAIVDPDSTIPEGNEFDNISNVTTVVKNGGNEPFINLTIAKSATPSGLVQNGTIIVYTLTVTNGGSDPAFNVTVKDFLPAGTTFVSAWDDTAPGGVLPQVGDFLCTYALGVVTCTGGTLDGTSTPPDGPLGTDYPTTRIIKVQVTAANVASLDAVNQAFVDPDNTILEGDETDNTSSVLNNIRSFIDLTAKKTGGDSAAQSSTFEYELQAINTAAVGTPGATAYNVTLHDALPVGVIVLGAQVQDADNNDWQCQVQENPVNVVDCVGSLPTGTTVKVKIAVFVTATNDVKLINEACIDWLNTTVESDETNNCAKTQTTVGAPDLAVTKSALNNPVTPGQNEVYTINVVNIGNVDATSVTITDTLPSGLTFVSALGSNGFTCTGTATVTCTYTGGGAVALAKNGGSTTITLTAQVGATATGPITNSASATSVPADPNTGNNTGSTTVSVGGAGIDLQLLSAIDTPDPVQNAGILTYTIMVLNSGTADAGSVGTPVLVRSTIDSGLTTLTAVASEGFSCVVTGTAPIQVDCTNATTGVLQAGHTVTITITGVVTGAAGTNITNEVKVDPNNTITETNETNNNFTVVTSVVSPSCPPSPPATPCFDLVTSPLLASADPVNTGDSVTYTLTVTNAGNVDSVTYVGFSDAVYIEIDVPSQIDYTSGSVAASSGFTCTDSSLPALFCFGDLAAGSGVVMSFAGTVNSSGSNSITATSFADPFSFIAEFDESNNNSSVTITRN
ncbi:MAG: hypothetical protein M3P38_01775 [Chloroflexota bacterium]|nr:hypothetical protein [Chloroflexota bacterium]